MSPLALEVLLALYYINNIYVALNSVKISFYLSGFQMTIDSNYAIAIKWLAKNLAQVF